MHSLAVKTRHQRPASGTVSHKWPAAIGLAPTLWLHRPADLRARCRPRMQAYREQYLPAWLLITLSSRWMCERTIQCDGVGFHVVLLGNRRHPSATETAVGFRSNAAQHCLARTRPL